VSGRENRANLRVCHLATDCVLCVVATLVGLANPVLGRACCVRYHEHAMAFVTAAGRCSAEKRVEWEVQPGSLGLLCILARELGEAGAQLDKRN
jgi:hypothetical protein